MLCLSPLLQPEPIMPDLLPCAPSLPAPCFAPTCRLVLQCSDVDGLLAHMPSLRQLVLSRQPAGLGFGPYIRWAWVEVCSWTVL
jgi:hypothetical protein